MLQSFVSILLKEMNQPDGEIREDACSSSHLAFYGFLELAESEGQFEFDGQAKIMLAFHDLS